ncbi:MAG: macro domain-containing protein [Actinomycetota bacterium]
MTDVPLPLDQYRSLVALDDQRSIAPDPEWPTTLRTVARAIGVAPTPNESPTDLLRRARNRLAEIDPYELPSAVVDDIERVNVAAASTVATIGALDLPTVAAASGPGIDHPLADRVSLVVADITHLDVDAIVNAANTHLLGCRLPGHPCIDNAIHSGAGPRLRDDCATIMEAQGALEPDGAAKITRAHALPSRYVVHTVGPQLVPGAEPTEAERQALASCYRSCLDVAAEVEAIRTMAFCGISTGVFSFPADQAAAIALATITEWTNAEPTRFDRILIDCFSERDAEHYWTAFGV